MFVSDASGMDRARFWLDDPDRSGSPPSTVSNPPWDFAGGTIPTDNPFDTRTVVSGMHTITAENPRYPATAAHGATC